MRTRNLNERLHFGFSETLGLQHGDIRIPMTENVTLSL